MVVVAPESVIERRGPGQPTKYTPDRVSRILDALREGNTRKVAGHAGGISHETFSQWLHRHPEFAESVTCAESDAERKAVQAVLSAALHGQWQAAAFWLERRRNKEWGKVDRTEVYTQVRELAVANNLDPDEAIDQMRVVLREIRSAARQ
jgi:hypothetical protein